MDPKGDLAHSLLTWKVPMKPDGTEIVTETTPESEEMENLGAIIEPDPFEFRSGRSSFDLAAVHVPHHPLDKEEHRRYSLEALPTAHLLTEQHSWPQLHSLPRRSIFRPWGEMQRKQHPIKKKEVMEEEIPPKLDEIFVEDPFVETLSVSQRLRALRSKGLKLIKRHLNFYRVHLGYFLTVSLIGGFILWIIEGPLVKQDDPISFVDALFMSTSALCVTGLISVDFSKFHFASQLVIWLLILCGGQVLMTLPLVLLRRYRFKQAALAFSKDPIETIQPFGLHVKIKANPRKILREKTNVEYRAMVRLIKVIVGYAVLLQCLAALCLCIYYYASGLDLGGLNPAWCAIFHTVSAFGNAGFSLFQNNFIAVQNDFLTLFVCGTLIMLGNVAFPLALRLAINLIHLLHDRHKPQDIQTYRYILDNPRRVFTHLFPAYETRLLLAVVAGTTLLEFVLFLALDWRSQALAGLSSGQKVLVGAFQSVSTRTAGFNAIDVAGLDPASLALYVGLMYLSAYPVTLTLRRSNVSQVWVHRSGRTDKGGLRLLSQNLLLTDFIWIYVGFLAVCLIERGSIEKDPSLGIFALFFEIVSAYGTVGLSLGYPGRVYSLSGVLKPASKLILCAVMLLGRHRGLPETVDRAVQLPHVSQAPTTKNEPSSVPARP